MDNKLILQRLGVILAYPLAYAYVRFIFDLTDSFIIDPSMGAGHFMIKVSYPVFAILFIIVNELVRRGRRENTKLTAASVFWYVMTFMTGLTACFGPEQLLSLFAMHLCAVYSVLVSNKILLGGNTSGFIIADLIDGFCVKSFAGFPNFIIDWKCFAKHQTVIDGEVQRPAKKNNFIAVIFIGIMFILMIISVSLMASIDSDIASFFDNFLAEIGTYLDHLRLRDISEIVRRCFFAIPVCFYLYGLLSRSAKSDGQKETRVAAWLNKIRGKGKTVSSAIVYVAAGVFVLLYFLFFIKRLTYMIGGFTGTVPDGMLVAYYARDGFFELVGIMAVNMCVYLAIILFGKTDSEGRFAIPAKILVTLLMAESIVFAIVAMSKLGLYYSIYGYTPKRILAMWGTLALGFASAMSILTVLRGRPHIRAGIIFTAVSYVAISILSGVLEALA
ncbi:MAG: DUF4173 domain-containing protein [Saccharofermentans sp.]|nr:DUF4173 domain-containing protein [Saccharofermentans sp.]